MTEKQLDDLFQARRKMALEDWHRRLTRSEAKALKAYVVAQGDAQEIVRRAKEMKW